MSAAFTPGPWSFDGPSNSRIVWAGVEHRVCFLTSNGPNLANARLIAAAPDLYEALEALLATHKQGRGQCCEAADRAIDALAKARGGQ